MNPKVFGWLVWLAWAVPAAASVETSELPGSVDAVTVYRGQALVTRLVPVPGPEGLREVVVTELPEHVVPGSLHAESADGVEVRSVRYRVRPVQTDVREEVRKFDEQIREQRDELHRVERHEQLVDQQNGYLTKLEEFAAPTANVELTKGVLNAQTLKDLTEYLFAERKTLADEELRLGLEERDVKERLDLLERERRELTGSSSRTAREAVVLLNLQRADGGVLRLRYLVDRASWSPSYNVRTDADRSRVLVEYNASIQQMSGEDWSDVVMTLSTATPSLVAKAPALTPMTIALRPIAAEPEDRLAGGDYKAARSKLQQQWSEADRARGIASLQQRQQIPQTDGPQAPSPYGGVLLVDNDAALNLLAGQLQNLDLISGERVTRKSGAAPASDEGVSVTYSIAERTSLPSRSDQQLIRIASLPMQGEFYKVATPVLTAYVYEQAAVTNQSEMVLLAGPVATYLAGEFVGHGSIPTVAAGEGFTVGFGIDSALRGSRELVERKETVQGGNRVVDFTYRLALENFGPGPAGVRLLDRLPQAEEKQIKLTLNDTGGDISEDAAYQHADRKKGILRWEIEVPAHAKGPDATVIEYSFRLEYDRQMTIAG